MFKVKLKHDTKVILKILKILLSWCITVLILPVITLIYAYKSCVILLAKLFRPDLRPIANLDTNFAVDKLAEEDEINNDYERKPLNIIGFYMKMSEIKLDLCEFRKIVKNNLIDNNSGWNWKLKSYIVRFCGHTFWKECPDLDIRQHVKHVRLRAGDSVEDFLNKWILIPFPPCSPLWEFTIVETNSEEFIALKIHHAMGDGLSIFQIGNSVLNIKNNPHVQKLLKAPPLRIGLLDMLDFVLRAPEQFLEVIGILIKAIVQDPFKNRSGNEAEQWISTHPMKLSDVKSISKKHGVGFMTVLLSIYAGGIRRFLKNQNNGEPIPDDLLIPVPIPWPGRPKNFIGNHWNTIVLPTPIKDPDPLERLARLQERINHYKSTKMFLVMSYVFLNLTAFVPLKIHMFFRHFFRIRYSLSPVLAADDSRCYDGRKLQAIYGIAGLVFPTFGIMAITVSFKDELMWTITGAKDLFQTQADLDLLTKKYIVEEFEELKLAIKTSDELT